MATGIALDEGDESTQEEAAVAYRTDYLFKVCRAAGFNSRSDAVIARLLGLPTRQRGR